MTSSEEKKKIDKANEKWLKRDSPKYTQAKDNFWKNWIFMKGSLGKNVTKKPKG